MAIALTVGFLLSGCSNADEQSRFDQRVLARVNGATVTVSEYTSTYINFLIGTGLNDEDRTRHVHLENLIDAELLTQEASRRGWADDDVGVREKEMQRRLAVGGRYFEEAFLQSLAPPSDEEIRQAFVRWNTEVVLRHLFFTDPEEAAESYRRLESGVDFLEEAARVYGLAEIDSAAGYLGTIGYYQADDAFAEAAYALAEGEYSEPVRSRFGWHIVRADRILRNPLLTESEFQTRRKGLSSQFRLRKRRLEGDRFVRSFMEQLDVRVSAGAVRAMGALIDEITNKAVPEAPLLVDSEVDGRMTAIRLAETMQPDTPLIAYRHAGKERVLTAAQYAEWLPYLPFEEARIRTAASVGRALRNEVLFLEGERAGLEDLEADIIIDDAMVRFLSRRMRDSLRATELVPADSLIMRAIDRLNLGARGFSVPTDSLRVALAPAVAEYELLKSLRVEANISVDDSLFEAIKPYSPSS